MQTNGDDAHLALARTKFKPVARALDDVSKDLKQDHGRSAVLRQKGPMQQISQNTCRVQYTLQQPNEARLSLTFIVVGDEADCVLLQAQERLGSSDKRANPGQVDQHLYGVEELDDIKAAVRAKISAHLKLRARH
jgi:hypothetical protein